MSSAVVDLDRSSATGSHPPLGLLLSRSVGTMATQRKDPGATMGLSWQQGPLGHDPNGRFLTGSPMPERLLFAEPLRRRMSVELGGHIVARSDDVVLLFEPGRYPVAYFPLGDIADGVLRAADHRTKHLDLGETKWFDVVGGDGHVAFAWRAMDAFYEEDERILGHAADPYHRIDIRRSSRHLVVRMGNQLVGGIRLVENESPAPVRE